MFDKLEICHATGLGKAIHSCSDFNENTTVFDL